MHQIHPCILRKKLFDFKWLIKDTHISYITHITYIVYITNIAYITHIT